MILYSARKIQAMNNDSFIENRFDFLGKELLLKSIKDSFTRITKPSALILRIQRLANKSKFTEKVLRMIHDPKFTSFSLILDIKMTISYERKIEPGVVIEHISFIPDHPTPTTLFTLEFINEEVSKVYLMPGVSDSSSSKTDKMVPTLSYQMSDRWKQEFDEIRHEVVLKVLEREYLQTAV